MLHWRGEIEAFDLAEEAKGYLELYATEGSTTCFVPFIDISKGGKQRYVKFVKLSGVEGWTFTEIVDAKKKP